MLTDFDTGDIDLLGLDLKEDTGWIQLDQNRCHENGT